MVGVTLTTADVEFVSQASGSGSAWAIFPFWLFMATPVRAESEALWNADQMAFEIGKADFVMSPRVKVVYRNWLLFDYASAEVQGKAVRIK